MGIITQPAGRACEVPKSCRECPRTNRCRAPHYGGSRCRYAKEINDKTIKETLSSKTD